MEKFGPHTTKLLNGFGIDSEDIVRIENGDISWDIIENDLLLFNSEGGHRHIAKLSESQVEELINSWEFERRESKDQERPITFPFGEVDDWTGIRPGSDWQDLIKGYREAVEILATTPPRTTAAPYLYLCRHTLELQMKAVIMLGQQSMHLAPDLPSHHDLQKLWTAAFPIAKHNFPKGETQLADVRQVVDDYHMADAGSFSFRYPVTKGNKPVDHASFIHAFSHKHHASQFRKACDTLDEIINKLRLSVLLSRIFRPRTEPEC